MAIEGSSSGSSAALAKPLGRSQVIELPHMTMRRLNLLLARVLIKLQGRIDREEAGFLILKVVGEQLKIDHRVTIDTFPGDDDFYFVLFTRKGPQLPLVSSDIKMMADFISLYILERIDQLAGRGAYEEPEWPDAS